LGRSYLGNPNEVGLTTDPLAAGVEINKSAMGLLLLGLKEKFHIQPTSLLAKWMDIVGAGFVSMVLPALALNWESLLTPNPSNPVLQVVLDESTGTVADVTATEDGCFHINISSQEFPGGMSVKLDREGNVIDGVLTSPHLNQTQSDSRICNRSGCFVLRETNEQQTYPGSTRVTTSYSSVLYQFVDGQESHVISSTHKTDDIVPNGLSGPTVTDEKAYGVSQGSTDLFPGVDAILSHPAVRFVLLRRFGMPRSGAALISSVPVNIASAALDNSPYQPPFRVLHAVSQHIVAKLGKGIDERTVSYADCKKAIESLTDPTEKFVSEAICMHLTNFLEGVHVSLGHNEFLRFQAHWIQKLFRDNDFVALNIGSEKELHTFFGLSLSKPPVWNIANIMDRISNLAIVETFSECLMDPNYNLSLEYLPFLGPKMIDYRRNHFTGNECFGFLRLCSLVKHSSTFYENIRIVDLSGFKETLLKIVLLKEVSEDIKFALQNFLNLIRSSFGHVNRRV
jgi:hypothetical protein